MVQTDFDIKAASDILRGDRIWISDSSFLAVSNVVHHNRHPFQLYCLSFDCLVDNIIVPGDWLVRVLRHA